ncbi:hypothetical protein AG0111_0g12554 [Alternaria gaisen]|uniref:Uncharacterized protein n=1 Tax=Alternaria gaisen TaxID=167740 RepID=A0ACB6F4S0_9PLEO|nr:hypothetical protein AG0111_0g12554 [Alternaria gaisen]
MALARHSVLRSRMALELASISVDEPQSYISSVNSKFFPFSSLNYWVFACNHISILDYNIEPIPAFFVAGLPARTMTGVLRNHIMRLNSSVSCEEVDAGDFPSPCPGGRPLTVSWVHFLDTEVRVCVPGGYTAFPWSLSRNRQDLTEEVKSSAFCCKATTTRGYFELGNNWNNNTYRPLLGHWPDPAEMEESFNDWTDPHSQCPNTVPSDTDTCFNIHDPASHDGDPSDTETWKVPGPWMTSALALFGNGSWLNTAAEYMPNHTYNGMHQDGDYANEDLTWPLFRRGMPLSNL